MVMCLDIYVWCVGCVVELLLLVCCFVGVGECVIVGLCGDGCGCWV